MKAVSLEQEIRSSYLESYKDLLASEIVDDRSIALSFPLHFSGNHRIEFYVTKANDDVFILSDSARVITELRSAGYRLNKEFRTRLMDIAATSGLKIENDYLLLQCDKKSLGDSIQKFAETAKTIGDAYLVHRIRPARHNEILVSIKDVLEKKNVPYQTKFRLNGEYEPHKFDFYVPANGRQALALAVLGSENTRNAAEVWGFRCDDLRRNAANRDLRIGIVYDRNQPWKDEEKGILKSRASLVVSDDDVATIGELVGH